MELFEQSGRQATEVARELGIRRNQLYKWQAELQSKSEGQAFQGPGRLLASDEDSEVNALRREIAQLREKNAILKKAAADIGGFRFQSQHFRKGETSQGVALS